MADPPRGNSDSDRRFDVLGAQMAQAGSRKSQPTLPTNFSRDIPGRASGEGGEMSLNILRHDGEGYSYACFFDSSTMWAFGPVFSAGEAEALAFLKWSEEHPGEGLLGLPGGDPRSLPEDKLARKYADFRGEMRECGDCGEWVVMAGCPDCEKMECCKHERSVHDEEGCGICDCENKIERE